MCFKYKCHRFWFHWNILNGNTDWQLMETLDAAVSNSTLKFNFMTFVIDFISGCYETSETALGLNLLEWLTLSLVASKSHMLRCIIWNDVPYSMDVDNSQCIFHRLSQIMRAILIKKNDNTYTGIKQGSLYKYK